MNNKFFSVKNISLAALLTSLVFTFTAFIQIPLSVGYFNLGDIFILFSAIYINPYIAAVSGLLGAGLADLYGGYFYFIPFTVIAKASEALVTGLLFRRFGKNKAHFLFIMAGALVMVFVYALSYIILDPGFGLLIATSPFDLVQAFVSSVLAYGLYRFLFRYRDKLFS